MLLYLNSSYNLTKVFFRPHFLVDKLYECKPPDKTMRARILIKSVHLYEILKKSIFFIFRTLKMPKMLSQNYSLSESLGHRLLSRSRALKMFFFQTVFVYVFQKKIVVNN